MSHESSDQSCLIICPGIHDSQLTQGFLQGLQQTATDDSNNFRNWIENVVIFPTQNYPAYSAFHILDFLQHQVGLVEKQLVFISFSAGVAGAIGAAWGWQLLGGNVRAFIALDGWGVPLSGNFPIHRLSHDYFTHWSSALLGAGDDGFYADPAIEHLDLWGKPESCRGWWVNSMVTGQLKEKSLTTAAQFMTQLFRRYLR